MVNSGDVKKNLMGGEKLQGVDEVTTLSVRLMWRGRQSIVGIKFNFQNKVLLSYCLIVLILFRAEP